MSSSDGAIHAACADQGSSAVRSGTRPLATSGPTTCSGILLQVTAQDLASAKRKFTAQLERLHLQPYVEIISGATGFDVAIEFRLRPEFFADLTPDFATLQLADKLGLDTRSSSDDLEREILLAMLASPVPFQFPSYAELAASIRIRKYIVEAARKTTLDFQTTKAERPEEYWRYVEDRGFLLLPGKSLIAALKKTTQPEPSGTLYSFSCYRATEYVILLGIAQELETGNPSLLAQLENLWRTRPIMSGEFHERFLIEYGSLDQPLPLKYFVPGDRTWFRNPEDHSSDVVGYEGSWVIYLGAGLFANFWKRNQPYTLLVKCLEIFHWRNAVYPDPSGQLQLDETIVDHLVQTSLHDPVEAQQILQKMLRLREPPGVYVDGGCIDASCEYPRRVCCGTSDFQLPEC